MGTLLDTSVLIDLERGRATLPAEEDVAIAAITASELLQGVLRADARHRPAREAFVEGVLAAIPTIPFSLTTARIHASLWAQLASRRATLGAHDLIVAATAISLGWSLATLNRREFERMPGLELRRQ